MIPMTQFTFDQFQGSLIGSQPQLNKVSKLFPQTLHLCVTRLSVTCAETSQPGI